MVDMPAVDTAAVEATVAADTAASANGSVSSVTVPAQIQGPALASGAFLLAPSASGKRRTRLGPLRQKSNRFPHIVGL